MFKTEARKQKEQDERDALRERMHGPRRVDRTCAACGATHLYGVCDDCDGASNTQLRERFVIDAFALDAGDDRLAKVAPLVQMFAGSAGRSPGRPNAAPWDHVGTEAIGDELARLRADAERRKGGPCDFCGVDVTVEGTSWHRSNQGVCCGPCHAVFGGIASQRHALSRSKAAAILCGLRRAGALHVPPGLGAEVGVVSWNESGHTEPNRYPFAHLDFDAMRLRARRYARAGGFAAPAWWQPDEVGQVIWG